MTGTEVLGDRDLVNVVEVIAPRAGLLRRGVRRLRRIWFVHNSGRFDRPSATWRAAITYLRHKGSLVTGTEAAGRDQNLFRAALAGTDWSYAHLTGAAEGECYGTWDAGVLDLFRRPFARKLTDLTWTRSQEYGGKKAAKVHALVLPLRAVAGGRKWWVVVWHAPLDNTGQRAEVWIDTCDGIVELQADLHRIDPDAEFVLVGDVNKNLREPDEATAVRRHLTGPLRAVTSWAGRFPRRAGTHGRQLIDFAIAAAFAACQLLRDLPDSDHRAFRYRPRRRRRTKEKP